MYKIATLSSGGKPVSVPEKDYRADVDAMLARVGAQDQDRLPRQPQQSHRHLPSPRRGAPPAQGAAGHTCCWCSMRPTSEYVRRNDYEAGLELVATTDNTVMTRTFSKIYGLAALRLGWAYCPAAMADVLNRVRGPFNVDRAGDRRGRGGAGGPRARRDRRCAQREMAALGDGRDREAGSQGDAERRQFRADPLSRTQKGRDADAADEVLKARGIILRRVAAYGLPDCLRMTIGTEDDNRRVVAALQQVHGAAHDGSRVRARGADRPRPDRLVAQPCHAPGAVLRAASSATRRSEKTRDTALRLGLVTSVYASAAEAVRERRPRHPVHAGRGLRADCQEMASGPARPAPSSPMSAPSRVPLLRDVGPYLPEGVHFIPGHPIAGTEHSGPESGLRRAVRRPLVRADAAEPAPTRRPSTSSRRSGGAAAATSR